AYSARLLAAAASLSSRKLEETSIPLIVVATSRSPTTGTLVSDGSTATGMPSTSATNWFAVPTPASAARRNLPVLVFTSQVALVQLFSPAALAAALFALRKNFSS